MNKSINTIWYILFFLLFPVLFYKQSIGINVLFYVAALIGFWSFVFGEKSKSKMGLIWLVANTVAATSVALYGSLLSIAALIAVVSSTAVFFNQNNVNPISSILAWFKTLIVMPFSLKKNFNSNGKNTMNANQIFLYILLPATILIGFAILYSMSDVLFADLLNKIDFDIFTVQFFITLFIGLITIFTIAHAQVNKKRARLERLGRKSVGSKDRFPLKLIPREYEQTTGIITLGMLNLLIFSVIFTDIRFRVLQEALPEGLSHAVYLHQGIFALILSIACAIVMMAWLYRTKGNNHPALKTLSLVWLAQNIVLVLLNVLRNSSYIHEFSLTYKRIGVYFYLLLAMIGLAFTMIYIMKRYNLLYLVKLNSYTALIVLVLAAPVPWDKVITHYNVNQAIAQGKTMDLGYILSLPNADLNYVHDHLSSIAEFEKPNLERFMVYRYRKASKKKLLSKTIYESNQVKQYDEKLNQ